MFRKRASLVIPSDRLILRLPEMRDHREWVRLRKEGAEYLRPWEPVWGDDHFTKKAFSNRVLWSRKTVDEGKGLPLFLIRQSDQALLGAVTLDNVRRGPAQTATLGYWTGQEFARHGYMSEALLALVHYAFTELDLSRIEAACLPENTPSRGLLEKSGFKYEGVAQSYLQIAGRWRNHVLYSNLRADRRGRTDAG